jgi:hypothetical protein
MLKDLGDAALFTQTVSIDRQCSGLPDPHSDGRARMLVPSCSRPRVARSAARPRVPGITLRRPANEGASQGEVLLKAIRQLIESADRRWRQLTTV